MDRKSRLAMGVKIKRRIFFILSMINDTLLIHIHDLIAEPSDI